MTQHELSIRIDADPSGARRGVSELAGDLDALAGKLGGEVGRQASAAAERLRELGRQEAAIEAFLRLRTQVGESERSLRHLAAEADSYAAQITQAGPPTAQETAHLNRLRQAADAASGSLAAQKSQLQQASAHMQQHGVAAGAAHKALTRIRREITQTAQGAAALNPGLAQAVQGFRGLGEAASQSDSALGATRRGLQSISAQLSHVRSQILEALGLNFGAHMLRDVEQTAAAFDNLRSRIGLVAGQGQALEQAWQGVADVALRTHTRLDATAELFSRLAQAGKDAGLSAQDASRQALKLAETINQAVAVSGASAQASDAAVRQLVQALQSGVLRGDEFNSVMEQSPRLARALADGLGVTVGQLRNLSQQGQLTADTVIRALQNQSSVVAAEFSKLPASVSSSLQDLSTKWTLFIGQLNQGVGATQAVAGGIGWMASHLDELAGMASRAGLVLTAALAVQGVAALRQLSAQMRTASGSARLLTASLNKIPAKINIAIAATGFEAGWQIGEMLHQNSELARKLGVGLNWYFQQMASDLQLIKEAAQAVFTSDTVEAAFERWRKRAEEVNAISADLWREAAKAPQETASAADAASASMQGMGQAAMQAGAALEQAGGMGTASLGKVTPAASAAVEAVRALAAGIGASLPVGAQNARELAQALADVAFKSEQAAQRLTAELPAALDKLGGKDLADFKAAYIRAMQEAGASGELVQASLDAISRQAARSLGIDVGLSARQMSDGFRHARDNVALLAADFDRLQGSGVDATLLLTQGLQKMMSQARNTHDIDELRARIEALREQLGGQVANGLLEQAAQKARQLGDELDRARVGVNSLREAHAELGLKSREELAATAARGQQAYEAIMKAGQQEGESQLAWQARKSQAAQALIQRLIEANGGVADAAIRARAAQEGVTLAMDKTGQAAQAAGRQAAAAYGQTAQAAESAAERIVAARQKEIAAQEKSIELSRREAALQQQRHQQKWNVDAGGLSLNTAGRTVAAQESEALFNQRIARYWGEEMIGSETARRATTLRQQLEYFERLGITRSPDGSLAAMKAELERLKNVMAQERQAQRQAAQPKGPSGQGATVQIHIAGGKRYSVATDAQGAQALQSALRELQAARARAAS